MQGVTTHLSRTWPLISLVLLACESDGLSFEADIQPELDAQCIQCHNANRNDGGLDLMTSPYASLVEAPSNQSELQIVALDNHLESYLWHKINGSQAIAGGAGTRMPLDGPFNPDLADLVADWIDTGAMP